MAGLKDTRSFFTKGNTTEWEYVLSIYKDALKLKAQQKNKKPEELFKLDCWYQEELPKLIQSRKEKHLTHDELVQTMKWKLCRGKWRPRLTDLVRMNTPAAVLQVSKKAFRRLPNLASAIQTMSTLKGIGPATASAVLAAGAPELAPYMADECMLAIPECQSIDYTVEEYLIFTEQIQQATSRLNESDKNRAWTPHRVEKALWTYVVISEFNPSLIKEMRLSKEDTEALPTPQNGKPDSQGDAEDSKEALAIVDTDVSKRNNGEQVAENNNDTDNIEAENNNGGHSSSSSSPAPPGGGGGGGGNEDNDAVALESRTSADNDDSKEAVAVVTSEAKTEPPSSSLKSPNVEKEDVAPESTSSTVDSKVATAESTTIATTEKEAEVAVSVNDNSSATTTRMEVDASTTMATTTDDESTVSSSLARESEDVGKVESNGSDDAEPSSKRVKLD